MPIFSGKHRQDYFRDSHTIDYMQQLSEGNYVLSKVLLTFEQQKKIHRAERYYN